MITLGNAPTLAEHIQSWKNDGQSIGFVPTMGALHDGHLSLVEMAKNRADKVVVSIFVNPTQFAPHEDFDAYPRHIEDDKAKLESLGIDGVYTPATTDLYPNGPAITVKAGEAAKGLESDFRPHFFDGVTTIVHRLFRQVQPDIAIFGEKDYQQLQVIKEMVAAQNMDIEIIGGETKRDEYGLALSSRNAYLSPEEITIARSMNQIIRSVAHGINEGINVSRACKNAYEILLERGFREVDYVAYKPEWKRVLVAAWLGKTRLIDNVGV